MTSLNYASNNVIGWVAALRTQGIDLTSNAHLKVLEEAKEYAEDPSIEEAADVFISLIASLASKGVSGYDLALASKGVSGYDLALAVEMKMVTNRSRTWKEQTDGTYHHV
jgi:hypothetical protein